MSNSSTCRTITLRITPELETALAHFPRKCSPLSSAQDQAFDERWQIRQIAAEGIFAMADHYAAGGTFRPAVFELTDRTPRRDEWRGILADVSRLLGEMDSRLSAADEPKERGAS